MWVKEKTGLKHIDWRLFVVGLTYFDELMSLTVKSQSFKLLVNDKVFGSLILRCANGQVRIRNV